MAVLEVVEAEPLSKRVTTGSFSSALAFRLSALEVLCNEGGVFVGVFVGVLAEAPRPELVASLSLALLPDVLDDGGSLYGPA
mmetsp:Transcript_5173/g.8981  ORF Transcript_5173/g.8981 Transcript_5173/m.8981 type:complete len:82 (+) Transcript_5173:620-865(+)